MFNIDALTLSTTHVNSLLNTVQVESSIVQNCSKAILSVLFLSYGHPKRHQKGLFGKFCSHRWQDGRRKKGRTLTNEPLSCNPPMIEHWRWMVKLFIQYLQYSVQQTHHTYNRPSYLATSATNKCYYEIYAQILDALPTVMFQWSISWHKHSIIDTKNIFQVFARTKNIPWILNTIVYIIVYVL